MKKPLYDKFERMLLKENNTLTSDIIKVEIAKYKLCRQISKWKVMKILYKLRYK